MSKYHCSESEKLDEGEAQQSIGGKMRKGKSKAGGGCMRAHCTSRKLKSGLLEGNRSIK